MYLYTYRRVVDRYSFIKLPLITATNMHEIISEQTAQFELSDICTFYTSTNQLDIR